MLSLRKIILLLFILIHLSCKKEKDAIPASIPFPAHIPYSAGVILPSDISSSELDRRTGNFYTLWKSRYLKPGCQAGEYYIYSNVEQSGVTGSLGETISISEGHGYGMLIISLMAGYDPKAKIFFDGLYKFYRHHPSKNNNRLMAWNQVKGCVDNPDAGNDSATDGDLDIAYALLLADKQWGSNGEINYLHEALEMINAIMEQEMNQSSFSVKLGDWADLSSGVSYDTRTSDFMTGHFKTFYNVTADPRWNLVINQCYNTTNTTFVNYSPQTGLLPDFLQYSGGQYIPARPNYLESEFDGDFSYNACRTPWRLSMDFIVNGDGRALAQINTINSWIRNSASENPENIMAGYDLSGNKLPPGNDHSLAFTAPLAVAAMTGTSNQQWLNDVTGKLLNTSLDDDEYYGNSIKMLCLIVVSGNWWAPY
ncbi:MAG: glycosyl hydrolase family 8 [Cytophagaceae bacterium]